MTTVLAVCLLWLGGATADAGPENWPRTYNQGVAAYQTNDFAGAAQAFEQSLPATDRGLQARAFYNLGNASYRLGQAQPAQAQELWKRALQHYQQALLLEPNDPDAKFNREFVRKKLEELEKQQQQQQQQQQQNQNQGQDKKDDPNQPKQDQSQQQKDRPQPNQQQPQPKDGANNDQPQRSPEPQPQQPQPGDPQKTPPRDQPQDASQTKPGTEAFDKQQARALLDRMREEERLWDFHPELQMKDLQQRGEPAKDW